MLAITKTVAPVEQSKHIAHSQCDVTKTIRIHRYPKHLFQNREDLFFMKNKTKVILGLAAMLAGTAGIAGVSTFAWFTTQNTAKVTFNDAIVRGDTTHISVSFLDTDQPENNHIPGNVVGEAATVAQDTNNHAFVNITGATTQVVDLSGNGQSFIRPQNYLGTGYSSGASVYYATGVSTGVNNSANSTYFMTFTVRVTNNSDVSTDVYIGTGSGVAASTTVNATNSAKAALATRVGIFDAASATPDTKIGRTLWDPNTNDTTNEVIDTTSTGGTEAFFAGSKVYTHELTKDSLVPNSETQYYGRGTLAAPATSNAVARAKPEYLCTLPALNDERLLTISMWIEGTDSNASDVCISGHVGLTLNLTGVQHAA